MRRRLSDARVVLLVSAALLGAAIAFPLGVIASHSFTDVPTSHPFHADIAAVKTSGVSTTGCGGGKFCPEDYVTRGQMAAFLNRLGALGPGKVPVVNADKVDGHDDVLAVGDFATYHVGPWLNTVFSGGGSTVKYVGTSTEVTNSGAGTVTVTMPLETLGYFGVSSFGFAQALVCYGPSMNVSAVGAFVRQLDPGEDTLTLAEEPAVIPLTGGGCINLVAENPQAATGATAIVLALNFSAAATASLGEVRVLWTPVN